MGESRYLYPCLHCGETAFYYDRMPEPGDRLHAVYATLPDGSKPLPETQVRCTHCGYPVNMADLRRDLLRPV